jgi:hypothetical protein
VISTQLNQKIKDWKPTFMALQAIMDGISSETIPISSFSEHALLQILGPVHIEIASLWKQPKPMAPRHVSPTATPPPSLDAVSTPLSTPSTSYWDSSNARSLFQLQPEESIQVCLQCRLDLLNGVYDDWRTLKEVLDDGEATESKLSSKQQQ